MVNRICFHVQTFRKWNSPKLKLIRVAFSINPNPKHLILFLVFGWSQRFRFCWCFVSFILVQTWLHHNLFAHISYRWMVWLNSFCYFIVFKMCIVLAFSLRSWRRHILCSIERVTRFKLCIVHKIPQCPVSTVSRYHRAHTQSHKLIHMNVKWK